jgi:uncharacterized protein HemX
MNTEGAKDAVKEEVKKSTEFRGPITFASLVVTAAMGTGIYIYYQLEKEKIVEKVSATEITTAGKPALGG